MNTGSVPKLQESGSRKLEYQGIYLVDVWPSRGPLLSTRLVQEGCGDSPGVRKKTGIAQATLWVGFP